MLSMYTEIKYYYDINIRGISRPGSHVINHGVYASKPHEKKSSKEPYTLSQIVPGML